MGSNWQRSWCAISPSAVVGTLSGILKSRFKKLCADVKDIGGCQNKTNQVEQQNEHKIQEKDRQSKNRQRNDEYSENVTVRIGEASCHLAVINN